MLKSIKIRLIPTKEQQQLMFKSVGVARFTYNWGLAKWKEQYDLGEKPNATNLKKLFNNSVKKDESYKWLYEVSGQITAQAFRDLSIAFKNFFNGTSDYPKFKTKRKSIKSFYVRHDAIKFEDGMVNIEKIGKVKFKANYEIPKLSKYTNPRCKFDGKYWYLTFGFEQDENQVKLNKDLSVGIDLGIKDLAVINVLDKPIKNINKTRKMKLLYKRLRRLQRKLSRKYEANKSGNKYIKTKNIIKLENKLRILHRKIANIRNNHIHQATNKIIKLYPYRIVMEDLNVKGMMKNRHLSKAISRQGFYEFIRQIKYKCEFNGIKFIQADRFFPSSKKCSCCGGINPTLKLKDRIYHCPHCNFIIDRDKNASINLANYKLV